MIGADVGYFKVVLFDSADWSYRYELSRLGPQLGGEWLMFEKTAYMYNSTYVSTCIKVHCMYRVILFFALLHLLTNDFPQSSIRPHTLVLKER